MVFSKNRLLKNSIDVCYWNINGVKSRNDGVRSISKLEMRDFMNLLDNHDIICISETKIGPGENDIMQVDGFTVKTIHRKRNKRATHDSGGLAIYIRNDIKSNVKFLPVTNSEYAWVKIEKNAFNLTEDLFICFIYINPENSTYSSDVDIIEHIKRDIAVKKRQGKCLLMGDFNGYTNTVSDQNEATFNERSATIIPQYLIEHEYNFMTRRNQDVRPPNNRGKDVLELCKMCDLRLLNGRKLGDIIGNFTCYGANGITPSVIDYAIADCELFDQITFFHVLPLTIYSDHCPIEVKCRAKHYRADHHSCRGNEGIELKSPPDKYRWQGEFSKEQFEITLNNTENKKRISDLSETDYLLDNNGIDSAVDELSNCIVHMATLARIPKQSRRRKPNKRKNRNRVHCDRETEALRRRVKRLCREVSKHPLDRELRKTYYTCRKQFKKRLKRNIKEVRENMLKKLEKLQSTNTRDWWNIIDKFNGLHSEKGHISDKIPPVEWYNYFRNLMNKENTLNENHLIIEGHLQDETLKKTFSKLDFSITSTEVFKCIQKLKTNKAPGCDAILNEMLKAGKYHFAPALARVFNMILISGKFPSKWSESYITPIFKGGCKTDPANYRGICLSSSVGKLFCSILNRRLVNYLTENNMYVNNQIGFREGQRTSDHIFTLKTIIDKYVRTNAQSDKSHIYFCFVDLRKAFDSVWRKGLFYKMLTYGIGGNFYKVITHMYENLKLSVKLDDGITNCFETNCGVKQGCTISPTLFNLYLNDLPRELGTIGTDPVEINRKQMNCLMYADDIVLISKSRNGMQTLLNRLEVYCKKWLLEVNIKKTKMMICNKGGKMLKHQCFKINGENVETVKQATYLGLIINNCGTFNDTLVNLVDKSRKVIFKLFKSFGYCLPNIKVAARLFDSLVKPILLYGSEVWGAFIVNFEKLGKVEKGNSQMYFKNNIESVHLQWLRNVLGVNKKSSKIAVLAEVGSYPLLTNICQNVAKYWARMRTVNSDSLLYHSFQENKAMLEKQSICWLGNVQQLLRACNAYVDANNESLEIEDIVDSDKVVGEEIEIKMRDLYNCQFKVDLDNDYVYGNEKNKLRTYRMFKKNIEREKYLTHINNYKLRKNICRLRISSHNLPINTGRHIDVLKNSFQTLYVMTATLEKWGMNIILLWNVRDISQQGQPF